MLTISKPLSAGQARTYHQEEFGNARENYYTSARADPRRVARAARAPVGSGGRGPAKHSFSGWRRGRIRSRARPLVRHRAVARLHERPRASR